MLAGGCFTITAPDPGPAVAIAKAPRDIAISLEGCEARVTDYIPVWTTETFYGAGRRYRGGGFATASATTYVPDTHTTEVYREAAKRKLEEAGFVLRGMNRPEYAVRIDLGDLCEAPGAWKRSALYCCTLFMVEREHVKMSAALRIYENASGRLVHSQDIVQEYRAAGWSPIPFFGMLDYEPTQTGAMRHWCRLALAEKCAAAAADFLAAR